MTPWTQEGAPSHNPEPLLQIKEKKDSEKCPLERTQSVGPELRMGRNPRVTQPPLEGPQSAKTRQTRRQSLSLGGTELITSGHPKAKSQATIQSSNSYNPPPPPPQTFSPLACFCGSSAGLCAVSGASRAPQQVPAWSPDPAEEDT